MHTKILIILILLTAGLSVAGWIVLAPKKTGVGQHQEHKDIYYCPMHPHYTSDKPGDCPICYMKLVKKQGHPSDQHAMQEHVQESMAEGKDPAAAADGRASVAVSTTQQQLAGVKTTPVKKQVLKKTLRVPGYVATNHELYQIQDEYVKARLDFVTKFRDDRRLEHTRRNWETHRETQLKLHEAQDELLRLGLSPKDIEKLHNVSWKTPWDQPEFQFFKEEGSPYWVVAQIFEADRGFLEPGQKVEIEIPSYNEKTKGTLRTIGGIFDPATRTATALIEIADDYRGELEGNMFVNVAMPVELHEALTVPQTAVMDTGLQKIVYVQTGAGMFEPRAIEVTAMGDHGWAVKSGLKEGETIAVEGNFLLDSESRLQAVVAGASSGGHSHGN